MVEVTESDAGVAGADGADFEPPAPDCILCHGEIGRWASKAGAGRTFHYDRCRRCGFAFVNPRPTLAALGRFYEQYDVESTEGDRSVTGQPKETRVPRADWRHRRLVRRALSLRPAPGRLLDVGCGFGGIVAAALEAGLQPTGLEANTEMCAAVARLGPPVTCVAGLFEQFAAPPRSFDYIVMSHVLEHAHDPYGFVAKAHALLAPGGVVWIELPNFDGVYRRLGGTRDPMLWPPAHLNHFNRSSLPLLCERVGLRVAVVRDSFVVPRNVLSKRLGKRARVLAPLVEAGTVAAAGVAKVLTKATRSGVILSVAAMKPPESASAS